jgi:hypothetical protein
MLPLALLMACCTPRPNGYSSFEILYGRPPPIINRLKGDLRQIGNLDVSTSPGPNKNPMPHFPGSLRKSPNPMGNWAFPYQPEDMV